MDAQSRLGSCWMFIASLTLALLVISASAQDGRIVISPSSHYVVNRQASQVVVFVHGLNGNARDTWLADSNHYWPQMVADDPDFTGADIYVANYPTPPHGNRMSINDLVSFLEDELEADGVFSRHQQVIFVAHSLGGIIVQELLLKYRDHKFYEKVPFIYFYATPQTGSELANVDKMFKPDPLIKELARGEGNFILPSMDTDWLHSGFSSIKRFCAYETQPTRGFKIVDRESATRGCQDQVAIDANHVNIVKPASIEARSYTALKNKFADLSSQSNEALASQQADAKRIDQRCSNGICVAGDNSAPLTVNNFERPSPAERRVTQQGGQAAIGILQKVLLPPRVVINVVAADSEINYFARQLGSIFLNASWPVSIEGSVNAVVTVETAGGYETYRGEGIACYHQPQVDQAVTAVRQALATAGFPCKDIPSKDARAGMTIFVGTRFVAK